MTKATFVNFFYRSYQVLLTDVIIPLKTELLIHQAKLLIQIIVRSEFGGSVIIIVLKKSFRILLANFSFKNKFRFSI
jgi:hypothetical protein